MKKRTLRLLGLCCSLLLLNCCYIVRQGCYVAKYSFAARRVGKVLRDPALSPREKEFFGTVSRIREFAFDTIGLTRNTNYTTYVKVEKQYLVDVVAASEPDSFKSYTWRFPFFGKFPYKGFFRKKDALDEAEGLREKGYDVTVGPVDAFSTLGFFSDPLYSFWVTLTPYELASLIIHEETHATIFVKNQIAFNEGMATFVGDRGALLFIKSFYGDSSAEYRNALLEKEDDATWMQKLRELHASLAACYAEPVTRREKLEKKQRLIEAFKQEIVDAYSSIFKTNRFKKVDKEEINNAYLAVRMNYYMDQSLFDTLFRQNNSNLAATVAKLKGLKHLKGEGSMEWLKRITKGKVIN